jgi:hypothetical protein
MTLTAEAEVWLRERERERERERWRERDAQISREPVWERRAREVNGRSEFYRGNKRGITGDEEVRLETPHYLISATLYFGKNIG